MLTLLSDSKEQGGFSLIEMMLAMLFSSMMMVSVAAMYPQLQRQSMDMYRLYRLEQSMRQVLLTLEKDMRRSGFLFSSGQSSVHPTKRIYLGAHPQASANSCIIIQYDLNHNGTIDSPQSSAAEQFGYRWLNDVIEQSRGVENCNGSGWDKLLDQSEIIITRFYVELIDGNKLPPTAGSYYFITLEGHWKRWPHLKRRLTSRVREMNKNA